MASLLDFNTLPQGGNAQFADAAYNIQGGQAAASAGLQTTHLADLYKNRTVPDLYAGQGAKGNLYSGGAQESATRAAEDYTWNSGQVTDQLRNTLASLATQRLYSSLGVSA